MPAEYSPVEIAADDIPEAVDRQYQHTLDIYASEVNKTLSVWRAFDDGVLEYRPHPKSMTVAGELEHELLSGRRFFGAFLGLDEPDPAALVPSPLTVNASIAALAERARARLAQLAVKPAPWWNTTVTFFDVERPRVWVFWRRVLHSAHHRTQLTMYLRLLDRAVPPIYGPTADVTWTGADPTRSVDAARR
jgi:uncharacterized damage-inducible protein DinB